jgi:hypothetical protein
LQGWGIKQQGKRAGKAHRLAVIVFAVVSFACFAWTSLMLVELAYFAVAPGQPKSSALAGFWIYCLGASITILVVDGRERAMAGGSRYRVVRSMPARRSSSQPSPFCRSLSSARDHLFRSQGDFGPRDTTERNVEHAGVPHRRIT